MGWKVVKKDPRRCFRIDSAREAIQVDIVTSLENVEKLALVLESELEEMVSATRSTVGSKVKSVTGTPKGKTGKDGKSNDAQGKNGEDGKGKGKVEPCYIFSEFEEVCKNGQQ